MMQGWIGLDVGGTGIKAGLVVDGRIVAERKLPTDCSSDRAILEQLAHLVEELMVAADTESVQVGGTGVAVPGSVDSGRGVAVGAANLPWNNTPICSWLQERTGLPTFLENDTNAAAVGELVYGAGQGVSDLFYMAIGTGVGGGIISGGQLIRGGKGEDGGEIGHIIADLNGPVCVCGQRGCLEALAAAPAIARLATERATAAGEGPLWSKINSGKVLEAKDVFEAAKAGDPTALSVVDTIGLYLSVGLIAIRRVLAPDLVIIGGGVAGAGQLLLDALDKGMESLGLRSKPVVKLSGLSQPGIVGAAAVGKSNTPGTN